MVWAGGEGDLINSFPRLSLASYPTPLEHLPRLSKELKREIYIKRDDVIGPAMGGNKTRKLEYLLADARQRGAKKIVTFGGLQSNHARITAAVRGVRFEPHILFRQSPSSTKAICCSMISLDRVCTLFHSVEATHKNFNS